MLDYFKELIMNRPNQMITYAEYMEAALYHPTYGYYMREGEKIGRQGDFITTSNISDIYGSILAKWFLKNVRESNLPAAVCEVGAGSGRFAKAFIEEWNKISDEPLQYFILEQSPFHKEIQQKLIHMNENIKQINSLEELKPFEGLIFSNELFDALPVHVIEMRNEELLEVMVSVEGEALREQLVPLTNNAIINYLEKNDLSLINKQRIEIPLVMESVITGFSDILKRGLIITVDYGYTNEEWMDPIHKQGSLRGYYKHQQINQVLQHPGEMDITSHIHFDSFIKQGEEHGLRLIKKLRQNEFFLEVGILDELKENYDPNPFSEASKKNRAIRSLIMPNGMSGYFHVVVQHKGMDDINIFSSDKLKD